jgi:hypothetical protein
MNTKDMSAYQLLEAAFKAINEERHCQLTSQERVYADAHHLFIKEAWDKVRNFESDEDREFNDQVWARAKEEAAMSREEYDRQLDTSHMATFE